MASNTKLWRDCWELLREQGSRDRVVAIFALFGLLLFPLVLLWGLLTRNWKRYFPVLIALYAIAVNVLVVWIAQGRGT